jgi:ABC-type nitrate/sulfonate/bicarbonate transport system ATPase subunit
MITVDHLSYAYEKHNPLLDVSFSVDPHEIVAIIGTSGSGKTTLFKLLCGILKPTSGTIVSQPAAYMPQQELLLPWRTLLNNVLLTDELGEGKKSSEADALARLREMGLDGWENAFPDQLSSGMRQRVSLARAIHQRLPVLLLDEPFAPLDIILREQMYALLKEIRRIHGTTIVMATHDFRDVCSLADRILLLSDGYIAGEWLLSDWDRNDPASMNRLMEELKSSLRKDVVRR